MCRIVITEEEEREMEEYGRQREFIEIAISHVERAFEDFRQKSDLPGDVTKGRLYKKLCYELELKATNMLLEMCGLEKIYIE